MVYSLQKIYTEHLLSTISGGTELAAGFTNGNRDNIKQLHDDDLHLYIKFPKTILSQKGRNAIL